MEDHIKKFVDMLSEYHDVLENQIFNNMFLNSLTEDSEKETLLLVLAKFNEHGVSSKVLFEIVMELVKEGVLSAGG